jgi:hypothetical protein
MLIRLAWAEPLPLHQTICSGSIPAELSLTGFTGSIQWQSSPDGLSWNNITGAQQQLDTGAQMGALTSTTHYRALVTSGVCSPAGFQYGYREC